MKININIKGLCEGWVTWKGRKVFIGDPGGKGGGGGGKPSGGGKEWKPSMSEKEANEWNKNSAIKDTLYHGTPNGDSIKKNGFDEKLTKRGAMFGPGIYLASDSSMTKSYGKQLDIKVNINKVKTFDSATSYSNALKKAFPKEWETAGIGTFENIQKMYSNLLQKKGIGGLKIGEIFVIFNKKSISVIKK